jgi:hypothetical protein
VRAVLNTVIEEEAGMAEPDETPVDWVQGTVIVA